MKAVRLVTMLTCGLGTVALTLVMRNLLLYINIERPTKSDLTDQVGGNERDLVVKSTLQGLGHHQPRCLRRCNEPFNYCNLK